VVLLRKLLWKLFTPYEVELTVEAVQEFLIQHAGLCKDIVEPAVMSLAREAEKTVYSIRINNMKPEQLALILITNVVGNYLGSGRYHTYRAVLGMVGSDMFKLWNVAQNVMLKSGYCTEAEIAEDNAWLRKQVQQAG